MTPTEFKNIRQQAGLSQSRLACYLGLRSKSHISKIENGKQIVTEPVAHLMLLLDHYGVRLMDTLQKIKGSRHFRQIT